MGFYTRKLIFAIFDSMKYVYALLSLLCLGAFLYFGHKSPVGQLPPVVDFVNPYTGFWQQAERPRLAKRYFTAPVENDIQIVFDDNLIPHIYANSYKDAIYAQGILHAHFRLWQMDITNRATSGRIAEIVGKAALESDEEKRRMGLRKLGDHLIRQAAKDKETIDLLSTYTEGVNNYISQLSESAYPIEFKLLRYQPEEWTLAHTGSVAASLVHSLCYRNEDLENTEIVQKLGESFFEKYYPAWNPRQKPIIREHEKISPKFSGITPPTNREFSTRLPQPDRSNGSNNWAIHRSQTVSQQNLLANDPHLGLSLPSLWYELHIHLPERQIYGVSFPGIPGIVLGFNDEIAWGSTNVSHDVADWLSPVWKDSTSWTYFYEGEWREADIEKEIIYVRDQDSVVLEIPKTKLGRIPYPEKDHDLHGMAFYWGPLESQGSNLFKTFMGFNKAGSYSEFKNALKYFTFPAQNFVFADRGDTVALHVQGKLPSRKNSLGFFVRDSMTTALLSHNLPQDKLPREINPQRGYVGSANQHSTYPEFPHAYRGYFDGFRGRTLDSLLRSDSPKNFEQMKKIQLSTFSLEAKEALPLLLENLDKEVTSSSEEIQLLENWNYSYTKDSKAATLFSIWWENFQERVFEHLDLPINPDSWRLIQIMDKNPNDTLFYMHADSTDRGLKNISTQSYRQALDEYQKLDSREWNSFKETVIPHLGQIDAFSSRLLENGGTRYALNSVKKSHGPSWRMIVQLGDTIRAEGVYPGGQSGNPGSPYYNNFVKDWEEGKYHPLKMTKIDEWGERVTKWEIKTK